MEKKTNGFGIFMHVCAGVAVMVGIVEATVTPTSTSMQQAVLAVWQVKFILYAILFEIIALNCKN